MVRADDGTRLAAYVDGPDSGARATLVLAHGWTLDHRTWDRVVHGLRAADPELRVVRYDQRGHGASAHGPKRPTIRRLGDDLAGVVRALAPDGDVVLAGHSMGGMSILAMAGRYPELVAHRVRGVALVATAASLAGEGGDHFAGAVGAPARWRGVASRALPWAMRALAAAPVTLRLPSRDPAGTRALLFGREAAHEDVTATHELVGANPAATLGRYFVALQGHDEMAALAHLASVPTSILVGSRDRLTPRRFSDVMAAELPHATYDVYEGAGHMLPLERTDEVTAHLLRLAGAGQGATASEARR